ncbi:MAG: hypothetical protein HC945_03265 [Nitrosarchaeum sp.]|nr:hypothetical protein [Nitrosarchaeum sp.]
MQAHGLYAYVSSSKTLLVGDLHLGKHASLQENVAGISLGQDPVMKDVLDAVAAMRPARVVLLGDVLDGFSGVRGALRAEVIRFLSDLAGQAELVLVQGNHDRFLPGMLPEGLRVATEFRFEDVLCLHGDVLPERVAGPRMIVIGHVHPAVELSSGARLERFKCFLLGTFRGRSLLVLPSVPPWPAGANVLRESSNSPLVRDFGSCGVVAIEDGQHVPLGRVKDLRALSGKI